MKNYIYPCPVLATFKVEFWGLRRNEEVNARFIRFRYKLEIRNRSKELEGNWFSAQSWSSGFKHRLGPTVTIIRRRVDSFLVGFA